MSGSFLYIAEGIGAQADANTNCQLSTGMSAIGLIKSYMVLQQDFSKQLNDDAEAIFIANMQVPGNPGGTALVSAATEQRSIDSTNADQRTGQIDNIIQGEKSMAQILGNAMTAVFDLEDPINELLKSTSDIVQQMLV